MPTHDKNANFHKMKNELKDQERSYKVIFMLKNKFFLNISFLEANYQNFILRITMGRC